MPHKFVTASLRPVHLVFMGSESEILAVIDLCVFE